MHAWLLPLVAAPDLESALILYFKWFGPAGAAGPAAGLSGGDVRGPALSVRSIVRRASKLRPARSHCMCRN